MKHLLIVEDDAENNQMIAEYLETQGYKCTQAYSGSEGKLLFEMQSFDLVLLDLMLPGIGGDELVSLFSRKTPVIVLSARSGLDSKVQVLSDGAEDYICKPFDLREVVARVRTILRRFDKSQGTDTGDRLSCGGLTISEREHCVYRDGVLLSLTPKEYELLVCFLKHPRQVFTRTALLDQIWGYDFAGDTRTVDIHVQRIRKKTGLEDSLVTVFGVGYKYVPA